MLAGVGYVLMGAGIPLHIPGVLDAYAAGRPAEYRLAVTGAVEGQGEDVMMRFDPADYAEGTIPSLSRPRFLAIVSSNTLAATMLRRASGRVDGLVIESPTAGGHNAPPRGKLQLTSAGEPVYGDPTTSMSPSYANSASRSGWRAGTAARKGCATRSLGELPESKVGTAFAFSEESGLRPDLKMELLARACGR